MGSVKWRERGQRYRKDLNFPREQSCSRARRRIPFYSGRSWLPRFPRFWTPFEPPSTHGWSCARRFREESMHIEGKLLVYILNKEIDLMDKKNL